VHPELTQKERKTSDEDEISPPSQVKHKCGAVQFYKWDEDRRQSAKFASPLCGGTGSFSTACSGTLKEKKDSLDLVNHRLWTKV
jgi:hypothetical protein